MVIKFLCNIFPNGTVDGIKFKDGKAEVESIHSDIIAALKRNPFVEMITDGMSGIEKENAVDNANEDVPRSTYKNRLLRKTKPEILKVADDLGLVVPDPAASKDIIVEQVLAHKYPNE
jgi:hypothetical protein